MGLKEGILMLFNLQCNKAIPNSTRCSCCLLLLSVAFGAELWPAVNVANPSRCGFYNGKI